MAARGQRARLDERPAVTHGRCALRNAFRRARARLPRAARQYAAIVAPAGSIAGGTVDLGRRPSLRRRCRAGSIAPGARHAARRARPRAGGKRPRRARSLRNSPPEIRAAGTLASGLSRADRGAGRSHDARRARRPHAAHPVPARSPQYLLPRRTGWRSVRRLALLSRLAPGSEPHWLSLHHRRAGLAGLPHRFHLCERHQWPGRDVRGRRLVRALRARAPSPRAVGRMVRPWRRSLGRPLSGAV